MKEYYDRRARDYDDWYLGRGPYAARDAAAWEADLNGLREVIESLPPTRTLDAACGTGFLTRHLPDDVVALDSSPTMLEMARQQAPAATYVRGDALALPFPNDSFGRIVTAHFYGHLDAEERARFLAEAQRVARELVVIDAAIRPDHDEEEIQQRELADGSRWPILKRYFDAARLAEELGGGAPLYDGEWFIAVRSGARAP